MTKTTACVFCAIINDGAPVTDLRRHGRGVVSFAPLNPVTEGHRVYVPTTHVERGDLDYSLAVGLCMELAAMGDEGWSGNFNLILNSGPDATQTIDHLHVHRVPRRASDGLTLPWTGQVKS
jgi:histidine triad (HIT) family protein